MNLFSDFIKSLLVLSPLMFFPSAAKADYHLSLKSGKLPSDVAVRNSTGLLPDVCGYKRGFTQDGWTVDRFGTRGYVAVSPTFTSSEQPCCNELQLPSVEIEEGMWLRWDARSVLPGFLESYEVTAKVEGSDSAVTLFKTEGESSEWTPRLVSLAEFAGKTINVTFVCNSVNRYALALDAVSISKPAAVEFSVKDLTQRFMSEDCLNGGKAEVKLVATNLGPELSGCQMICLTDDVEVDFTPVENVWMTGESREFLFEVPCMIDSPVDYTVTFRKDGSEDTPMATGKFFVSRFMRNLLVDKGTGMWCVSCSQGVLVMEKLKREYGANVICLDTHNGDVLANDPYFNNLGFRSIPSVMLNRIKETASAGSESFADYLYEPPMFRISFKGMSLEDDENLKLTATVESDRNIENSDGRYRIGYVLTSDFFRPGYDLFYQRNTSTQPSQEQFYYLPSTIPSQLIKFNDVTLTNQGAFEGIAGSVPANLSAEASFDFSWTVERPLESFEKGRAVAFVLDTQTGHIQNACAADIESALAGVDSVTPDSWSNQLRLFVDSQGKAIARFATPSGYRMEVLGLDGSVCYCRTVASKVTEDSVELPVATGAYVIRVVSDFGTSAVKAIIGR